MRIPWYERVTAASVVYALYFGGYGLVNRRIELKRCADLTLAFDKLIPFWSGWVAPFYLAYVMVLVPAFLVKHRPILGHAVLSFAALVGTSCVVFLVFPTFVPRPDISPATIAEQLVAAIFRADRPCCGFPSLHVSATVLAALVLKRDRARHSAAMWLGATLVALSTLFIKQHVLLDVVGGVALAIGIDWVTQTTMARLQKEQALTA